MDLERIIVYFLAVCVYSVTGTFYGNPPLKGRTLRSSPRAFILSNILLPAGTVTDFRFYSTGNDRELYLQVWRPLLDGNYRLVGQILHRTTRNGSEEVQLIPGSVSLRTLEGDLMGFLSLTEENPIAYTLAPFDEGAFLVTKTMSSIPVVGMEYSFPGSFFDKRFSVGVNIDRDEPIGKVNIEQEGNRVVTNTTTTRLTVAPPSSSTRGYTTTTVRATHLTTAKFTPTTTMKGSRLTHTVSQQDPSSLAPPNTGNVVMADMESPSILDAPILAVVLAWLLILTFLSVAALITACLSLSRKHRTESRLRLHDNECHSPTGTIKSDDRKPHNLII